MTDDPGNVLQNPADDSWFITGLVEVLPPGEVVHLDVPQVPRLGVDGGAGELVLEGLQVLQTGHPVLRLREHSDEAVALGRWESQKERDQRETRSVCDCSRGPVKSSQSQVKVFYCHKKHFDLT